MEANQTFWFEFYRGKLWITLNTTVFYTDRWVYMCEYIGD